VDTRVLQAIYAFRPNDFPAFVGQQVDVFIKAERRPREQHGSTDVTGERRRGDRFTDREARDMLLEQPSY
jgi:hypothetical protein